MRILTIALLAAVVVVSGCGGGGGSGTTSATVMGKAVQTTTLLPVENADVTLNRGGTAKTDSMGGFTIRASALGPQQLTVRANGYEDSTVDVNVQPGNTVLSEPVRLVVKASDDPPQSPGNIRGKVTLEGTTNASGAVVKLLYTSGSLYESKTTPSSGEYSIWTPIGTYKLRVEKSGYIASEQQISITDLSTVRTVNVTLKRG